MVPKSGCLSAWLPKSRFSHRTRRVALLDGRPATVIAIAASILASVKQWHKQNPNLGSVATRTCHCLTDAAENLTIRADACGVGQAVPLRADLLNALFWRPRGLANQHPQSGNVLVNVGPVDALTLADQLPMLALLASRLRQDQTSGTLIDRPSTRRAVIVSSVTATLVIRGSLNIARFPYGTMKHAPVTAPASQRPARRLSGTAGHIRGAHSPGR